MVCTYSIKFKKSEKVDQTPNGVGDVLLHTTANHDLPIEDCVQTFAQRYRKQKLSVTDFSSQLWCEKQLELTLITGRKRETDAMRAGIARHELLESNDHEIIEIEVETKADALALRLLNTSILLQQLLTTGKARELWVFGIIDGEVVIRGVIDELKIGKRIGADGQPQQQLIIVDTKTRRVKTEPSAAQKRTSAMQLSVYYWIIDQLRRGVISHYESLFRIYEVDPDDPLVCPVLLENNMTRLNDAAVYFHSFVTQLPAIKESMTISYEYEGQEFATNNIPFEPNGFFYSLRDLMDWWNGQRPTECVYSSEGWKCRYCEFVGMECDACPLPDSEISQLLAKRQKEKEEVEELRLLVEAAETDVAFATYSEEITNGKSNFSGNGSEIDTTFRKTEIEELAGSQHHTVDKENAFSSNNNMITQDSAVSNLKKKKNWKSGPSVFMTPLLSSPSAPLPKYNESLKAREYELRNNENSVEWYSATADLFETPTILNPLKANEAATKKSSEIENIDRIHPLSRDKKLREFNKCTGFLTGKEDLIVLPYGQISNELLNNGAIQQQENVQQNALALRNLTRGLKRFRIDAKRKSEVSQQQGCGNSINILSPTQNRLKLTAAIPLNKHDISIDLSFDECDFQSAKTHFDPSPVIVVNDYTGHTLTGQEGAAERLQGGTIKQAQLFSANFSASAKPLIKGRGLIVKKSRKRQAQITTFLKKQGVK